MEQQDNLNLQEMFDLQNNMLQALTEDEDEARGGGEAGPPSTGAPGGRTAAASFTPREARGSTELLYYPLELAASNARPEPHSLTARPGTTAVLRLFLH